MKKTYIKLASVVTSLALTVGMGISSVYAEKDYTPTVPLKTFQPAIERIVVDDNIEGGAQYAIAGTLTASNTVVEEDTGNTAVKLNNWGNLALVAKDNPIDADTIVVSFDFKTTGVSFEEAINTAGTGIDKDKRSIPAFALRAGKDLATESGFIIGGSCASISNREKQTVNGTWRVGASSAEGTATGSIVMPMDNADNNGYVNVTIILARAEVGACVKAMYVDGTDVLPDALRDAYDPKANWWDEADSEPRLKLYERMGSKVTALYFDNFLVYVPKPFGLEGAELSEDAKSATLKFNAPVGKAKVPKVTLADENGEYACESQVGTNQNELVVDFPEEININVDEKSYYLVCRNVASGTGDILEENRVLLGKDYVKDLAVTAAKSGNSVSVNFDVTPGSAISEEPEDMYVMAVLFKDNNIIGFKFDKTTGGNIGLNISGDGVSEATRVQTFMIDNPKNMRIISEVSDISF